jgi:hypothetical protein
MELKEIRLATSFQTFRTFEAAVAYSESDDWKRQAQYQRDNELVKRTRPRIEEVQWNDATVVVSLSSNLFLYIFIKDRCVYWRLDSVSPESGLYGKESGVIRLRTTWELNGQERSTEYEYNRAQIAAEMLGAGIMQLSARSSYIEVWLTRRDLVQFYPAFLIGTGAAFLDWHFA